ncbi:MAG: tRNA lysidine(34) synthetase TilS [Desulfovibrionaceae bacterium]|nr:tRNA lysidine(34) synthetase TilS [Desulfovibrionaceae bacterium]
MPQTAFALNRLPAPEARFCLEVERFIVEECGLNVAGLELTLAYSGGADSSALFYVLLALAPRLGFTLSLAHLDHALRPDSHRDLQAALELAQDHGLTCHNRRIAVAALAEERKIGKEEAGRAARLDFLRSLRDAAPERWIVYAHQLNDLAEDILMRLIRGGGWPALGGMAALDRKERLLRPLLFTERTKIEAFLRALGLGWIEDPLNRDTAFLRNRVRAEILPLFLRENPSFLEAAAGMRRLAGLDSEYFQGLLAPHLPTHPEDQSLLLSSLLRGLDKALRLRLYKARLEALGPGQPLLNNLLALDRAWQKKKTGALFQFPGRKNARLEPEGISFSREGS